MKKHFYHDEILKVCKDNHCSVDSIFEELQKTNPEVGQSTIYRNVEELVKKKKLQKITGALSKAVFETTKDPHAHFICKEKNIILDIPLPEIDLSLLPSECEIDSIDLRIYGKNQSEIN